MESYGGSYINDQSKWWKKNVGLWSLLIFFIVVAVIFTVYELNLNPAVIDKQAQVAKETAGLWSARQPLIDGLPSILVSLAYSVIGFAIAIGAVMFISGLTVQMVAHAFLNVSKSGFILRKETPNGNTGYYLAQPDSAVARHLLGAGSATDTHSATDGQTAIPVEIPGHAVGIPKFVDATPGSIDAQVRPYNSPTGRREAAIARGRNNSGGNGNTNGHSGSNGNTDPNGTTGNTKGTNTGPTQPGKTRDLHRGPSNS